MTDRRKSFTLDFKTRLALQAIKGHRTLAEIANEYAVHAQQAMEAPPAILADIRKKRKPDQEELIAQIYQQIGHLKVELDCLKRNRLRQSVR